MKCVFILLIISSLSLYSAAADLTAEDLAIGSLSISQSRIPQDEITAALKNQHNLDAFVVGRVCQLFTFINNLPKVFETLESGKPVEPKSALWNMEAVADEERWSKLPVYKGERPFGALTDFLMNGGKLECFSVSNLVKWIIISDLLGNEVFNSRHSESALGLNLGVQGLSKYLDLHDASQTVGSVVYVANVPHYARLIKGNYSGENVFRVTGGAEPTYVGFGEFFQSSRTETAIVERLYQETIGGELASKEKRYVEIQDFYKTHRPEWNRDQLKRQAELNQLVGGEYFFSLDKIKSAIGKPKP